MTAQDDPATLTHPNDRWLAAHRQTYIGQWVALLHGVLVGYDEDESTLCAYVYDRYGDEVVVIQINE